MLFKVVKCIQGGKFTFAIVPDEWERDGTIQWPRKHKFGKLTLGEILHPGEEWIEIQCVVVKKDIQTYKDAEKVLMKKDPISREKTNDDMRLDRQKDKTPPDLALNNSSNEQDEMNNDPLRLPEDSSGGNSASSLEKDTEQANKALEADNTKETDLVKTSNPHKATSIIPYIVETSGGDTNIIFDLNEDNTDTGDVSLLPFLVSNSTTEADTSKLSDSANYSKIDSKSEHTKENNKINKKLDDLTAKVSTILENQTIMSLNQASLSNMFEKFMRSTGCSFAVNEEKKSDLDFDVMQTADDLISFEEKLVDPVFRENMMEKFAIICKRSDGHGVTVAYKLVDLMFAREFLTQCSWSGLSRDDLRKVCFKMFHRTRDFFFKTVRSKDHLFTMEECDNFLKNILKNSKRRNTGLNLRTPSQKRRKRLKKLYTAQLYKDDSESGDGERETVESLIETAMTIEEE